MRTWENYFPGAIPPHQTIPHPSLEIRAMGAEALCMESVWLRRRKRTEQSALRLPLGTHLSLQDPQPTRSTARKANSVPTHGPPSQRPLRNTPVVVISSKALSWDVCLTVDAGLCPSCLP